MTKRTTAVLAAIVVALGAVLAVVVLAGSGSSRPDPAACRAAMQKQFDYGMSHPDAPAGTRPAACRGVSDKDVRKFAGEIISQYNGGTP
jgi:hypothetical protein